MVIIKFSSHNVKSIDAGKRDNEVFVKITHNDNKVTTLTEDIGNKDIYFFNETIMRNIAWVSFFEISEVFNIPEHEKAAIKKDRDSKKTKNEIQTNHQSKDPFDDMFSFSHN
jgi:hypothetical protein